MLKAKFHKKLINAVHLKACLKHLMYALSFKACYFMWIFEENKNFQDFRLDFRPLISYPNSLIH